MSRISIWWKWFKGEPSLSVYEITIDGKVTLIPEGKPTLDKFHMAINLNDNVLFTYDPSNYTRNLFNAYGTRLCSNQIQVFGTAYIEGSPLGYNDIMALLGKE